MACLDRDRSVGAVTELPMPMTPNERHGDSGHDTAADRATAIRLLTLRTAGMTYEQIAEEVGYSDRGTARHALMRALDRHEAESVTQLRAIENMRLDSDERVLRSIISSTSQPVADRLRAIDARTRLSARRARMNGLDAPQQLQVTSGAQAALHDALADLRTVVLGEVLDSHDEPVEVDDATT